MRERRSGDRDICEEVVAADVSMSLLPLILEACLSRCGKTNCTRVDCQHVLCAENFRCMSSTHIDTMHDNVDVVAHARRRLRARCAMRACVAQRTTKNRLLAQPDFFRTEIATTDQ